MWKKMAVCATAFLFYTPAIYAEYHSFQFAKVEYGVLKAQPQQVQLHWQNSAGKAYGSLNALKKALEPQRNIKMLMNAGIYSQDYRPAGLWIEQGKQLQPLNLKRGTGNFHIQPNGVFFIQNKQAQILTSQAYAKGKFKPDFALQSGPMLVINGKKNPQFKPALQSFHKRNAVCVSKDNQLYFVMTNKGEPNMYDFSQALIEAGCYQALYLDGTISNWYIPQKFNSFHWHTFVGMISVTEELDKN